MRVIDLGPWSLFLILILNVACAAIEDVPLVESMNTNIENDSNYTYLALGDSYTIGESVEESERWPMILAEKIRKESKEVSTPKIIARTGWTTDELLKGIKEATTDQKYDLVSLLIGVNNQYRGRDIENFRLEFKELLEKAILFAYEKEMVFVVSIPDWSAMPFAEGRDRTKIGGEIDAYNRVVQEECAKLNVNFVDITPISREALDDKQLVARDGLHPSGKMYRRWVNEMIFPAIADLLK